MSTLILTHADVVRLLDALPLLDRLREGFIQHSLHRGPKAQRAQAVLQGRDSAMVVFPGALPDIPAYTVGVHAHFPSSIAPTQGVVNLFDARSGALLAILDSTQLSALRTGLGAALSVEALARPDAARVAIVGASRQASVALRSLRLVRSLRQVRIFDWDLARATELGLRTYHALQLPAEATETLEAAVGDADLVICATASREPVLCPGMLPNGCHVVSLGPDEPGKVELSAGLIRQSRFFTDDRALAGAVGALRGTGIDPSTATELGEVLAGKRPGRTSGEEITLYAPVGLPFQDLAAAWLAYELAREDPDVRRVELAR